MTDRELSERLAILAEKIEDIVNELGNSPTLIDIIQELKFLSNQKYTPGAIDWDDLKNNTRKPTKFRFPF